MFRACLVALVLFAGAHTASAQIRRFDPEVEAVLQERMGVLRDVAKELKEFYEMGVLNYSDVIEADQRIAEAELELAKTREDRIRAREALLKYAEALEDILKVKVQKETANLFDLYLAKAARLRAKADLLLEKKSAPQ